MVRFLVLQIIYEITSKFVEELKKRIGFDYNRLSRMSIIEESTVNVFFKTKQVRDNLQKKQKHVIATIEPNLINKISISESVRTKSN